MANKVKRKNHEVTKSLLKRWESTENKLWVLDIENQTIEPRSLNATFAIENYLYVPDMGANRNDATEEWFAGAENELMAFLQRLESKDYIKPIIQEKLFKTLLALIGLSLRSSYEINKIIEALESDEELRNQLGADLTTHEQRHLFAVENMINSITQQVEKFCSSSVHIVFGTNKKLLVCDRPGADMAFLEDGTYFAPVGTNEYVYMDLQSQGMALTKGVVFKQSSGDDNLIDMINEHTISRARSWIVAHTKQELEEVAGQLAKSRVLEREAKDKLSYKPLTEAEQKQGWRLRKPNE